MPKLAPQKCVMVDQDVLALLGNLGGVKLKGEFYVNGLLEINYVYYTPFANVVSFCLIHCLCITEIDCLFHANRKQLGFRMQLDMHSSQFVTQGWVMQFLM